MGCITDCYCTVLVADNEKENANGWDASYVLVEFFSLFCKIKQVKVLFFIGLSSASERAGISKYRHNHVSLFCNAVLVHTAEQQLHTISSVLAHPMLSFQLHLIL